MLRAKQDGAVGAGDADEENEENERARKENHIKTLIKNIQ